MNTNQFLIMGDHWNDIITNKNPNYIYNKNKKTFSIYKILNDSYNYDEKCYLIELIDFNENEFIKNNQYGKTADNLFKVIKTYNFNEMLFDFDDNDRFICTFFKKHYHTIDTKLKNKICDKLFGCNKFKKDNIQLTKTSIDILTEQSFNLKPEYKKILLNYIINNITDFYKFGPYNLPRTAASELFEKCGYNSYNCKMLLKSAIKFNRNQVDSLLNVITLSDLLEILNRPIIWQNESTVGTYLHHFYKTFKASLINGKLAYNIKELENVIYSFKIILYNNDIPEHIIRQLTSKYLSVMTTYCKKINHLFLMKEDNIQLYNENKHF